MKQERPDNTTKTGGVTCSACGQWWPRDPALEVECPQCRAAPGVKCRRPSGHPCALHRARDRLAMERGYLERCPAAGDQGELADTAPATPPALRGRARSAKAQASVDGLPLFRDGVQDDLL